MPEAAAVPGRPAWSLEWRHTIRAETTVKKTDLYKNEGSKISGQMKRQGVPGRFANEAGAVRDRREQRKLEQSLGLVPFAVKLDSDLVKALHALAQSRGVGLNELVAELLEKGMKS
jgi:hypothetical protein